MLRIPRPYLYAGIMFFAAVGAYALGGEVIDLVTLLIVGLIGFGMRRYGLPVLPAVIGVILGPNAEQQLRSALQISDGSVTGLDLDDHPAALLRQLGEAAGRLNRRSR